jgi:hypothetical protein
MNKIILIYIIIQEGNFKIVNTIDTSQFFNADLIGK